MGDRRRSREAALQVLFQMEHGQDEADASFELYSSNFEIPSRCRAYARRLVEGVAGDQSRIDGLLDTASRNWRVERMSRVDRNILRLACWEMFFSRGEVPPKVAMNEAVELAKRYGGEESPGFVNALLDTLLKQTPSVSQP